MKVSFHIKPFDQLSNLELYQLLSLRQDIFVVEQNCPYLDADSKDLEGFHIFCIHQNEIIACSRLLPKGTSYKNYASIGRICCKKSYRGSDIALKIIELSIQHSRKTYPKASIKISAQAPLVSYYEKFGFVSIGEPYLEDDIPHQAMVLV